MFLLINTISLIWTIELGTIRETIAANTHWQTLENIFKSLKLYRQEPGVQTWKSMASLHWKAVSVQLLQLSSSLVSSQSIKPSQIWLACSIETSISFAGKCGEARTSSCLQSCKESGISNLETMNWICSEESLGTLILVISARSSNIIWFLHLSHCLDLAAPGDLNHQENSALVHHH